MFRIELFDRWPGFRINGGRAVYGRITWGSGSTDYETFVAPTDWKSAGWYRRQWDTALRRVIAGERVSTLIVSAGPPDIVPCELWDIWNLGGKDAVLHNRLHLPEAWEGVVPLEFNLHRPWDSAGAYSDISDDGERISEWRVPLHAIEQFISSGGAYSRPAARVWPPNVRRARGQCR